MASSVPAPPPFGAPLEVPSFHLAINRLAELGVFRQRSATYVRVPTGGLRLHALLDTMKIVERKMQGKVQSLEGSSLQTIRVKCREFIPALPLVPYQLWWLLFLQPTEICPFLCSRARNSHNNSQSIQITETA